MAVPVSDLQAVAPSAVIELFELQLNITQHGFDETYRFHAGTSLKSNGELVWAGNSYLRFPIEAEGFEYSGNGQLPRPKVRASNIIGTITALLLGLPRGLEGAKFTRIRTLARYLDAVNFPGNVNPYGTPDPTAECPREVFYVDRKTVETRDLVEFELAAAFDLAGVRAPKRQCIGNICQWKYRSAECGYTGPPVADANDKPLTGASASSLAAAYFSAKAQSDAAAVTLKNATTALSTARNTLNTAQGNWVLAQELYSPPNSFIATYLGGGTEAKWAGADVTLGTEYRAGAQQASTTYVYNFAIQRWTFDTSAVTAAQTAYNADLATYNTALSNYNTKASATAAALATWQASPSYQPDIVVDACGKRLASCKLRFGSTAELPFGSYPGIGSYFA